MRVLPLTMEKPQTDAQKKVKVLMQECHYSTHCGMKEWWAGKIDASSGTCKSSCLNLETLHLEPHI